MRIAIVNDMAMAVEAIRRVLAANPRHQIAWVANDGAAAVKLCAQDKPDLILMDLIMPVMDGVEATRRIMLESPCAIVVVTATVEGNTPKVFEAMGAGALDAVNTPILGPKDGNKGATALLSKIDIIEKLIAGRPGQKSAPRRGGGTSFFAKRNRLIGIGASAGGPAALATVLGGLPQDLPAAVVVIQHVDEHFARGLVEWLAQKTTLHIRLACKGDELVPGSVLVAGTGDHLVLDDANCLDYVPDPRDYPYRPSVDVFFESVLRHWTGDVAGVILTGMGRDGAIGLKALRNRGHYTIAQDQATSAVYGMPKAAAALDAAVDILPLNKIAPALANLFAAKPGL